MPFDGDDGSLPAAILLLVVLAHGGFVRGELLLNANPQIAGLLFEISLCIIELVVVEAELRLCDIEVAWGGRGGSRGGIGIASRLGG